MKIKRLDVVRANGILTSSILIFDENNLKVSSFNFPALIEAKTISPDKRKGIFATLYPDNMIYCYDIDLNTIIWRYKNHSHKPVLKLDARDNMILVFTGSSVNSANEEYQLTLNGELKESSESGLKMIDTTKDLPAYTAVKILLDMIRTADRTILFKALIMLQSKMYDKKSLTLYPEILHAVTPLLPMDDEIFELIWKILRRIMRKNPIILDNVIQALLSRIKKIRPNSKEIFMWYLDELGGINSDWIKTEIPEITKVFNTSNDANERVWAKNVLMTYETGLKKKEATYAKETPITSDRLELNLISSYKIKTKDHLLCFMNHDLVARLGWTKPSKLVLFDDELKIKWAISVPGRIRSMDSDSGGIVVSVSDYVKSPSFSNIISDVSKEEDGYFQSTIHVINPEGKIILTIEKINGFTVLIGISDKQILIWNDLSLSINSYERTNGKLLWSKSYTDRISSKYNMRTIQYYPKLKRILTVHTYNKEKMPVIPSIISVLDDTGNEIHEFEDDGFPGKDELQRHQSEGHSVEVPHMPKPITLSFSLVLPPPHYPVYHAILSSDGKNIVAGHYSGKIVCWSIDGKLEWIFDCKNKVKIDMKMTENGLVSALCENGDYFLVRDGKEIFRAFINMDFSKIPIVSILENFVLLSNDKQLLFFDEHGKR